MSDLPRHLQLLWGIPAPGRPGPKPRLTIQDIARAGIAIADRAGLAEVTLQSVAADVGVKAMSLYRYVDGRDALLATMSDVALGPADDVPEPPEPWRQRLTTWVRHLAARRFAHPWLVEWTPRTPPLGPNGFSWMESGLAAIDGLPLAAERRMSVLQLLDGWIQNHVRQASVMGRSADGAAGDGGPDGDARYRDHIAEVIDPGRFPRLSAAGALGLGLDEETYFEQEFELGLDILLDAIECLARREAATPTT